MRIAHIGDIHLTSGPRFDMTLSCIKYAVDDAIAADVDLFLVGGDLSGTTVPHRATVEEEQALASMFMLMADQAPVVCVRGNHDSLDFLIYGMLSGRHQIAMFRYPGMVQLKGPYGEATIYCMPYPQKSWLFQKEIPQQGLESQNAAYEEGLRDLLRSWSMQAFDARAEGRFTLGLMHLTVAGSKIGGGEVLIPGAEITLAPHDLEELGFDYTGLSHYHLHQQVASKAWYAGSPSAQNFGEPDIKGYLRIEIAEPGADPVVTHVPTPSRRLITIHQCILDAVEVPPDVKGAEVRVVLELEEEQAAMPTDQIVDELIRQGAYGVRLEKRILPTERTRCSAIATATTLEEQVKAYWGTLGESAPSEAQQARCLAKLVEVQA